MVVSYRNSTSNHNYATARATTRPLYLIEILHQTTTLVEPRRVAVWLYLIEILHQTTTAPVQKFNAIKLYLIEILHQTTTLNYNYTIPRCCILSKFYIKPQLVPCGKCRECRCILSKFYIKPQLLQDQIEFA